jgi:D-threo-aldose 1-dehydrogenase
MSLAAARRPLGATGISVPRLGIGGGSLASAAGEEGVRAVVAAAWDAGLRHFDTAAYYAAGESERRLGLALAGRPRGEFVVSTKTGRFAKPEGGSCYDYSTAGTAAAVATSLRRLGVERLDLVFIHDIQPELHGEAYERQYAVVLRETVPALMRLKAAGVIGAIGAAMRDHVALLRLLRDAPLEVAMLAGGCTLLNQEATQEMLPHCARHGIPVLFAAPFETGLLATGAVPGARYRYLPAPPEVMARTAALESVCARHGVTLAAAAMQFPLSQPAVASVVVGHQAPAEVARNIALLEQPVPAALWAELRTEGLIDTA